MDSPVAVVGGSGRLGRLIVQRLLDRGETVRALGRTVQPARRLLPPGASFVPGDVRDPGTLAEPLAWTSALVFCVEPGTDDEGPDRPEATLYLGLRNVLEAATARGARPHVVLVSQLHATHRGHPLNAYGRVLDWRRAGEELLREWGLPYTVVRPGWLIDDHAAGDRVRLEQGDQGFGQVSRTDVADACVHSLYSPSAIGVTFEMFNEPGSRLTDWEQAFAALETDRVVVA